MKIHIPPSLFVRQTRVYRQWCHVSFCNNCGLVAKYEDVHPVDPCPHCGEKLEKVVGRWRTTKPALLLGLLRREQGEWELKDPLSGRGINE